MLAAVESGFVGFNSDWGVTHTLDLLGDNYRMNDAKTDASGLFWAGSNTIDFVPGEGSLWRLDENWNATVVHTGLTLPNGIGWSPDNTVMYVVDSMQKVILKFPFDRDMSIIAGEPEVFAGPEVFNGLPDGLAMDTRGHIWLAEFGTGQLMEFSPDGAIVSRIAIPTEQTTSCAFVGPQLDKLWVTSAAIGLDPATDPDAGSIFEITGLPAPGIPVVPFAG
jgi:sugar lactone lactonase YvrE